MRSLLLDDRPSARYSSPLMPKAIESNSFVVVEYSLRDDEGDLLDASDAEDGEPIEYVHGYGMLVPGLEAALAGLRPGDEREIVVPASSGYGERDEELVMELDRSDFPPDVAVGDEIVAEAHDGEEVAMDVVEVKADSVIVDANHPLAGMTLHYKLKVREVRDATDEEVQKAAAELEEAQGHVHGEDCDHDHEEMPDLLTIGRKKAPDLLN
jgi:FKBP-type peptidyl-prolyl cis-trans isomerase SlyD